MPEPSSSSLSSQSDEELEDGSQPSVEDGSQPKLENTEVLQPLGKPKNKMVWKNVQVKANFINVKGGFNAKYHSAPSIQYKMGTQQYAFVKLCKNETLFLKGVGGSTQRKVI